jgi:hypothetical protein
MKEEDTLYIVYSPTSSSGIILSPGYSEGFTNTEGNTKIVISSLPNKFWLNLVYLPATPSSTDGCAEFPFLIYNGDSTSPIAARIGCVNVYFNKDVPTDSKLRTIDAIITGIQQITIAVKQSDSLYGAFQLYYSSKYRLSKPSYFNLLYFSSKCLSHSQCFPHNLFCVILPSFIKCSNDNVVIKIAKPA